MSMSSTLWQWRTTSRVNKHRLMGSLLAIYEGTYWLVRYRRCHLTPVIQRSSAPGFNVLLLGRIRKRAQRSGPPALLKFSRLLNLSSRKQVMFPGDKKIVKWHNFYTNRSMQGNDYQVSTSKSLLRICMSLLERNYAAAATKKAHRKDCYSLLCLIGDIFTLQSSLILFTGTGRLWMPKLF
nr:uncharacterized protein LOC4328567 [Oryza sativa Japonica Group]XP_025879041.1 uncharacterized protein LOC4328567 [Oryza sativa Japonica Group]XP_025879042.1 uncharacterized protein LOC4328567 [Oryza sativa Japonica Group]